MQFEKKHGLEARFRPEDKYCKPVLARSVPVTNIVLRVRRRRQKKGGRVGEEGGAEGAGGGEVEERNEREGRREQECHVEVLGLVKNNFEFTGKMSNSRLCHLLHGVITPQVWQITRYCLLG